MNHSGRSLFRLSLFSALTVLSAISVRAQQWTVPTPQELSMTSQSEVPGAPAVYLYREESTDDRLHMFSIYTRLKVLTEGGKEFGNVELSFARGRDGSGFNVEGVQGRTIHPDGKIIPFTGKPYEKLVQKTQGIKVMAKVFTMPDVEVGSIIEYRYRLQYD
ncbi:MAG: transglutaminase protein, partial [Edaphobacter sp.]|nr:transglutaminase protein [Edaphobacter sp.]